MNKVPYELVFGLIFGAVLLVRFLLRYLHKRAPQTDVEMGFESDDLTPGLTAPETPTLTRPVPAPPSATEAPFRDDVRRFSRRSLLGSRRAVQDAIVVAAILGPCRAHESRGQLGLSKR
jgi:hypothetical protein